jgi:hypothetical protein
MVLDVRRPQLSPPRAPPPTTALSFHSRAREAPNDTPSSLALLLAAPPHFVTRGAAPAPPNIIAQVQPFEVLPKLFPDPVWSSPSNYTAARNRTEEPLPSSTTEGSLSPGLSGHGTTLSSPLGGPHRRPPPSHATVERHLSVIPLPLRCLKSVPRHPLVL